MSFVNHQAALSAMSALNGTVFDPDTGDRLHIELAKSSSRKRHGDGGVYRVVDKRLKRKERAADHENAGDGGNDDDAWGEDDNGGDGGSDEPLDTENDDSDEKNELPAERSGCH